MVKSVEVNVSKYEVPKAAHIPQKTNYKTKNAANDNQHYSDEGGSDEGKGDHHGMKCWNVMFKVKYVLCTLLCTGRDTATLKDSYENRTVLNSGLKSFKKFD